jgi:hypothetical protein
MPTRKNGSIITNKGKTFTSLLIKKIKTKLKNSVTKNGIKLRKIILWGFSFP